MKKNWIILKDGAFRAYHSKMERVNERKKNLKNGDTQQTLPLNYYVEHVYLVTCGLLIVFATSIILS